MPSNPFTHYSKELKEKVGEIEGGATGREMMIEARGGMTFSESLSIALSQPVPPAIMLKLREQGVHPHTKDYQAAMFAVLVSRAVAGDIPAIKLILDTGMRSELLQQAKDAGVNSKAALRAFEATWLERLKHVKGAQAAAKDVENRATEAILDSLRESNEDDGEIEARAEKEIN